MLIYLFSLFLYTVTCIYSLYHVYYSLITVYYTLLLYIYPLFTYLYYYMYIYIILSILYVISILSYSFSTLLYTVLTLLSVILYVQSFISVSYTHLDVYKRQGLALILSLVIFALFSGAKKSNSPVLFPGYLQQLCASPGTVPLYRHL